MNMRVFGIVLLVLFVPAIVGQDIIDLSGESWTVINGKGDMKISATVPGQVHLDLM